MIQPYEIQDCFVGDLMLLFACPLALNDLSFSRWDRVLAPKMGWPVEFRFGER
jgi:hypothetical protein